MDKLILNVFLIFALFNFSVVFGENNQDNTKQFTFSWQLLEDDSMQPRGGITKGRAVELAPRNCNDWQKQRDSMQNKIDKDIMTIMSLVGMYRVSFDFLETIVFENNLKPDVPYQSWGTEYIFPIEVRDNFISLQHILIMKFAYCPNACTPLSVLPAPFILILVFKTFFNAPSILSWIDLPFF